MTESYGRKAIAGLRSACRHGAILVAVMISCGGEAAPAPLTIPFDFSKQAIGVDVSVNGRPLYMLLDTGVDPSVIDLATAEQLGLPLDRKAAGEGSGEGTGKSEAIPSSIRHLQIGGRAFGDVEALATDMKAMSSIYGRPLDGVLGYSFLKDKSVLIDYPARVVTLYSDANNASASMRQCRKRYAAPLRFLGDEHFPLVPDLRFGKLRVPATLDTGSNRMVGLYRAALQIKPLKDSLTFTGHAKGAGFRGSFESRTAKLKVPMGIGPFLLPPGVVVATLSGKGSPQDHVANIGNETFAAMKLKILLDYPQQWISLFGNCSE